MNVFGKLVGSKCRLGLSLVTAFCISVSIAKALPRAEAIRSGAARYEDGSWKVTPADEASIFTPPGFDKPGKAIVAAGDNLGKLKIVVRDKVTGKPTYCRMNVVGPDGNFYQPKPNPLTSYGLIHEPKYRPDGLPRGNRSNVPPIRYLGRFFYSSGEDAIEVPPGQVRVEVWKGFEYQPTTLTTKVEAGETQAAEITIERTLPMAEQHHYYSGDPHLHFPRESDAEEKLLFDLMEADDTRFGTIMAFNHPPGPYQGTMKALLTPQLRGMGLRSIARRGNYEILSGQEYRSTTFGHLNLFLHDSLVLPNETLNADDWPLYGELGKTVQQSGGYAFYAHGGYAQSIFGDLAQGNVNGVELLQFSAYRGMGLADWYHVLNSGFRFPILGACDYPYCRMLGDSKTYVRVEGEPDFKKWLRAAADGQSFVTSGPMLLLELENATDKKSYQPGNQVELSGNGPHRLNAKVRVRSDVAPVTNIQVIVNGEVVKESVTPIDQGLGKWLTVDCPIEVPESSWIAARAYSKSASGAPNAESHTNPVYIYVNGKAPYHQASLDELIRHVDLQIDFHQNRKFDKQAEVVTYYQRSKEILQKMRAAGGVSSKGHPSDLVKSDDSETTHSESRIAGDDLKKLLKPMPPKSLDEVQQSFETVNGFKMELVAHEPLVYDPIAAEFDENGQLYVCEMRDYPYSPKPGDKPLGTVRLLRDTDGDGMFDDSHIFADGLLWAGGVAPWKGGVFVASPPDIWYLKDTDGDFKADVRTKVFTGFGTQNQQAMLNNLKYGLDHKIYGATASNGGLVRPGEDPAATGVSVTGRDFRFDPTSLDFEAITGTIQFGNTFDDWGNRFVCSESRPLLHVVLPQNYLARNPYLSVPTAINNLAPAPVPIYRISPTERWRQIRSDRRVAEGKRSAKGAGVSHHVVDAAAGVTVYRGAAYPAKYYGNVFVGDSQNNLIHRRTLAADGVTFKSERADRKTEFVRSSDNWFRPVNFINAPDGTLYVLDMSREIIESVHIPSDVAQHIDLTNGRQTGRIYRLAPSDFRTSPPPQLGQASTAKLVATLENPNCWWRETAHRLIHERQDNSCVSALQQMLNGSKVPQARLLALWSLQGLNALTQDDLMHALADSFPGIREHAIRLTEPRLDSSTKLLAKVLSLADDSDPRVCFQLAFSLGASANPDVAGALAALAKRHAADPWIRVAVLSSATSVADRIYFTLIRDEAFLETNTGQSFITQLAEVIGARDKQIEVARALVWLVDDAADRSPEFRERILLALGSGLKQSGARLTLSRAPTSATQQCMTDICETAKGMALQDDASLKRRQRAIQLLGCFEFSQSNSTLTALLDPLQPQQVQLAALDALGDYDQPEVAALMLEGWKQHTPALRAQAIRKLLSRDRWAESYLAAVQNGRASLAEIDADGRTQLLNHRNMAIRKATEKLLATSPRSAVIAEYQPVLRQAGDAGRGREIFKRECSNCHRLADEGYSIGPDLTSPSSRDPEAILANILDPNRYVAPAHVQYLVEDKSGRMSTGMIASETATSITLTRGKDTTETILRANIGEVVNTGTSLMPEGLEKNVSPAEMADLLAYLCGKIESKATTGSKTNDVSTQPGLVEP
jgi:putative membrane-bound dehydrogenase-like protein